MNLESAQQQYDMAEKFLADAKVAYMEALDLYDRVYADAFKAYEASHPEAHPERIKLVLKLARAGDGEVGQAWQTVRRAKIVLIRADEEHAKAKCQWWISSR